MSRGPPPSVSIADSGVGGPRRSARDSKGRERSTDRAVPVHSADP